MLKRFLRYRAGLREYLRTPLPRSLTYSRLAQQLEQREKSFLLILKRAVFDQERSPYLGLLRHAGIDYNDIVDRTQKVGLDRVLEELFDAGVYVSLEEFKGLTPIERPGLRIEVKASDFDNPLLKAQFAGQTGGTRSTGRRVLIDFDLLTHEAAYTHRLIDSFDLGKRPHALWRILPPGVVGIKTVFLYLKTETPIHKWFTPSPILQWPEMYLAHLALLSYSLYASRRLGNAIPIPTYVPYSKADVVARWLEKHSKSGSPAVLDTTPSGAVRICQAALRDGIDIRGSFFQLGGEPLTDSKQEYMREAGCRAVTYYSMAELGRIAMPCTRPASVDDTHLLVNKLAVLQRPPRKPIDSAIDALYYTTVLPTCPKLMLNVESGDYPTLERRSCGCPWGNDGFNVHLSRIRSYEKLTTQGMCFLGSDVINLVEKTLPRKFGGCATDYQLVERVSDGLSRLCIVVSPGIGDLDETEVVHTAVEDLCRRPGPMALMTRLVSSGNDVEVVRREPYTTLAGKTSAIHVDVS
jgi:hypothetical protein